ncbi:MAG: haloacid dehalogenase type II [Alphaproteobacteria bacterium]|nr:haloacid dehalogenase type II [Alphaproteobacteria bacterium]MBO6864661.1 haloacid dehalogenase type II [Alphaproteobacteria bacterium]
MSRIDILLFDVLGTVVDWRGSITAELSAFLHRHGAQTVDAAALADDWVGRYDPAVDAIRAGRRDFVPLDVLNLETLHKSLTDFGIATEAIPPSELETLNAAWHRLAPWPDSVEGLTRLKSQFVIAPLSDGGTRMLVNMAKHSGLPWDVVLGADIPQAYKPMPEVYLRACALLGTPPGNAMLVAAHDYDLSAAQACGLQTAFVSREGAADPSKAGNLKPTGKWNYEVRSLTALADRLMGPAPA